MEILKKISKSDLIVWGIIIAFAIMNISLIFNDSVWEDEAYTMNILKGDFIEIVKKTAEDVHPPLYYFIAKIFTIIFGYSVATVKLASIVPVILSMIFVKVKSKKLFKDNYVPILFTLLIGFCPKAFSMNIELRMYTWSMFFVTCSGIYAYELYKEKTSKKTVALFILSSLCAAYTHYYAVLMECFIYLFLIISLMIKNRKNWKTCITIIITTIVVYLPWIPTFIRQFVVVRDYWWLTTFPPNKILSFIKYLFSGEFTNIFLILFAIAIIELFCYMNKKKKDDEAWFSMFCIFTFVGTILIGYMISILIRPMFNDRYMYPGAGLLFLGVSIALSKSDYKELLRNALIAVIILNIPFSFFSTYKSEYETGTEEFKKFAKENIVSTDIIITDIKGISWSMLQYYLPDNAINEEAKENDRIYIFTTQEIEDVKRGTGRDDVTEVFNGNIDNKYKFKIYKIDEI